MNDDEIEAINRTLESASDEINAAARLISEHGMDEKTAKQLAAQQFGNHRGDAIEIR